MKTELDSRHLIFPTRLGNCALLYREAPFFLTRVLLRVENPRVREVSNPPESWGIPGAHPDAIGIGDSIRDYFLGKRPCIQWPPWPMMDMSALTRLQKEVLEAVAEIPYGEVRTYKQMAEAVNRPKAYRFVGSTLALNPFPILIPCHRVIRSDQTLGNFGGGADMKKEMLDLEAGNTSEHSACAQQ